MYTIELRKMLMEESGPKVADQVAKFFTSEPVIQQMHMAIEDHLITMRDAGIGVIGPANGWLVNTITGMPSPIMRIGTREGLKLIMSYLTDKAQGNQQTEPKTDVAA